MQTKLSNFIGFYQQEQIYARAESAFQAQNIMRNELAKKYPRRKIKGHEIKVKNADLVHSTAGV